MAAPLVTPTDGSAFISGLPENEAELLRHAISIVTLSRGQVLTNMGGEVEFVHFLESGAVSLSIALSERHRVGVALVGAEGIVEPVTLLGAGDQSPYHVVIEVPGRAHRVQMTQLRTILENCSTLRRWCKCYAQFLALQAAQLAACNARHLVPQRLAFWLLTTFDRVGSDDVLVTQDFLSMMLGVRRASVSRAVDELRARHIIRYNYGRLELTDRYALEGRCCRCYPVIQERLQDFTKEHDSALHGRPKIEWRKSAPTTGRSD